MFPQKELHALLGITNYLNKFSPIIADFCESLRKLTAIKSEWTWNVTHQKLSYKAKSIIKEDACMKIYDETKPLYLETNTLGVGLGAEIL